MKSRSNNPMPTVQKQCHFCTTDARVVDYKDSEVLRGFMSPQSKIQPKRRTGLCSLHQRMLARAIKRAREMGLVPFTTR